METLALEPALHASLLQRAPAPAPLGARIVCQPGQAALFVVRGTLMGTLGPGQHVLDPRFLPFVAPIVLPRPMGPVVGEDLYWAKLDTAVELDFRGALATRFDAAIGERVTPRFSGALELVLADAARAVGVLSQRFSVSLEGEAVARAGAAVVEAFAGVERLADLVRPACWPEHEPAALESLRSRLFELGLGANSLRINEVVVPDHVAARLRLLGSGATQPGTEAGPVAITSGSRVRTHREGAWYSGRVIRVTDDDAEVAWDGATEPTSIPLAVLEPEPAYPGAHRSGTRVWAEHPVVGYSPGKVRAFNGTRYEVEWEDGTTHWLAPGQIRLS